MTLQGDLEALQGVADAEAGRLVARRELLEGRQELADEDLRGYQRVAAAGVPLITAETGQRGGRRLYSHRGRRPHQRRGQDAAVDRFIDDDIRPGEES